MRDHYRSKVDGLDGIIVVAGAIDRESSGTTTGSGRYGFSFSRDMPFLPGGHWTALRIADTGSDADLP